MPDDSFLCKDDYNAQQQQQQRDNGNSNNGGKLFCLKKPFHLNMIRINMGE